MMAALARMGRRIAKRESMRVRGDRVLDPDRMSREARDRLTEELYAVQREIFDGVGKASFRRYVIEPSGAETRIQVFRDARGAAVGYMAMHTFERSDADGPLVVVRGEVGVLRRYRGHGPQVRFSLTQCLRLWLRYVGKRKYVFACPIHPGSYWGVTKRCPEAWPRPDGPTPPRMQRLMTELAGSFGLPQVGRDPLVRRVGWITRDGADDRAHWEQHAAEEVRYYRSRNLGYVKGDGLLLIVPLTLEMIATVTWRIGLRCLLGRHR